jgi:predicted Zn-dependent protease
MPRARFINGAGISGKGMLSFFDKLTAQMHRYGYYSTNPEVDPFAQTHPMSADRVQNLKADLQAAPSWGKPIDAKIEERFKRVQAKLRGYVSEPETTLRRYPATDQSAPAHYARAYAYHKSGYPDQAAAETAALVKTAPDDPYFLELEGQILLESGRPAEAIAPLREATRRSNNQPLIAATFGHACSRPRTRRTLPRPRACSARPSRATRKIRSHGCKLGTVYERKGDEPRTALATAERAHLMGDMRTALVSARSAMANLPQGSTDWVRAQDISMVALTAMDDEKKRRR